VTVRRLRTRGDVVAATSGHPYARFATAHSEIATGVADGRCVIWLNTTHFGPIGHALGPLLAVADRLATADVEVLSGARWINLPRHGLAERPPGFVFNEEWDLRWSVSPPAPQPGEDHVVPLREDGDAEAINELLDTVMPDSPVRPGTGLPRQFFGVWEGSTLIACGADRSSPLPHRAGDTVGVVGAIAVDPGHRRRGWGAAVTAAITRYLALRHPLVVLGQAAGNDSATRLYPRLGYTGVLHLTSVRPA